MNVLRNIVYFSLALLCILNYANSSPLASGITPWSTNDDNFNLETSDTSPLVRYRAVESQQVEDVQKPVEQAPIKQEPVKQEPIKQQPIKQEPVKQEPVKQEPIKQQQEPVKQEPVKTVQEPVKGEPENVRDNQEERVVGGPQPALCPTCLKAKPDFSKAIKIAVKGNALAAGATAVVAAPALIKSAKVAGLAALIPIKLAAKGALIGGLIAKPIIIKSALVGATAAKLSHLFVGKPIAIGANLLAGAEALRAKVAAKKVGCVGTPCAAAAVI